MLDEVTVFQPLKFYNDDEIKRYVILRYRVKKVYPYAKLASERMNRIDSRVDSIKSKRQKRLYLKKLEKFVNSRNKIANLYDNLFKNIKYFKIPSKNKNIKHAYHLYPIRINFRKLKKSKKSVSYTHLTLPTIDRV